MTRETIKGNIPAYVMAIISVATALASYIYVSDTGTAKVDIKEIQAINTEQDKDISAIKQSIQYIVSAQTETQKDVKEILRILK